MRSFAFACVVSALALSVGCQSEVLRRRTLDQASTTTDYYYQQVLDNVAQIEVNPYALPYFLDPKTQQTQIQRNLQANYSLGWDFITSGLFMGRYFFDKQSSVIQGSQT